MNLTCYVVDDNPASIEVLQTFIEVTEGLELAGTESDSRKAAYQLMEGKVTADLTFLDIEMPGMNGIEIAGLVSGYTRIIFTTAHRDFALEAFDLNAVDYMTKPLIYERFLKCIEKVRVLLGNNRPGTGIAPPNFLFIRGTGKGARIKVLLEDIIYIKSESNYVQFVLKDKTILSYSTMEGIIKELPQEQFCRVHRSYAINMQMIDHVNALSAKMVDGSEIPLGKLYKKSFFHKINMN